MHNSRDCRRRFPLIRFFAYEIDRNERGTLAAVSPSCFPLATETLKKKMKEEETRIETERKNEKEKE